MMDFRLLINKKIIAVLIGDTVVYDSFKLPYLSGPALCELSTAFGLPTTYTWGAVNKSRWEYMRDLLTFLIPQGRVPELLSYLIQQSRFEDLVGIGDVQKINETHNAIVQSAISLINSYLVLSKVELRLVNKKFTLVDIDADVPIEAPIVKAITSQYIRELPERIREDLENKDYDSVITKSRTLLEEVLIFIIEKMTVERYKSNGDLVKIYQDATELLSMRQNRDWDKRVNEMLGGLHKLVSAISSMRNINSDAHGAGASRITIKRREAMLVANSSAMLAEYWLSVFERKE